MIIKGGTAYINAGGLDLASEAEQTVPGLYKEMSVCLASGKPVIIDIAGVSPAFAVLHADGTAIIADITGYRISVSSANSVTVSPSGGGDSSLEWTSEATQLFTLAYYVIDGNGTTYNVKDELIRKNASVSLSAEDVAEILTGNGTYQNQYKLSLEDEYTTGLPSFQVTGDTNLYLLVDSIAWIQIVQNYTNDDNYTWTVGETTATLELTYQGGGGSTNLAGIVFDLLDGNSVSFTNTGTVGSVQNGLANENATLPTIVTNGTGRISYNSDTSGTLTRNNTAYKFYVTRFSLSVGNTVTFTFTKV